MQSRAKSDNADYQFEEERDIEDIVFVWDANVPNNPGTASETHGAANNTWQATVSNPAFTWTAPSDSGPAGVAGYSVYWGTDSLGEPGTAQEQATTGYDPAAVTSGTYYLRVRTFDRAGNYSARATIFTFKYDSGAPTPSLSYTNGWQSSATITLTKSAVAGLSGVADHDVEWKRAVLDTGAYGAWQEIGGDAADAATTSLTGGSNNYSYKFRYRAKSGAGVWSAYVEPASVTKVDTMAPTITDNQSGDNTWRSSNNGIYNVDFSDNWSGLQSVQVKVGASGAWRTVTLPNGFSGTLSFSTNWSLPAVAWDDLAQGSNDIYVKVTDVVGNAFTSAAPVFYVKKDTVAPMATISYLNDWQNSNTIALTKTSSAGLSGLSDHDIEYKRAPISEGILGTWDAVWSEVRGDDGGDINITSFTGANGYAYKFRYKVINGAGEVSAYSSPSDIVKIDTSSPTGTVTIAGANNGYVNTSEVTLLITASDAVSQVAEMSFRNDGAGWSGWEPYAGTKSWALTSGDGVKRVNVKLRDLVQNEASIDTGWVNLDTAIPTGNVEIRVNNTGTGSYVAGEGTKNLAVSVHSSVSGASFMKITGDISDPDADYVAYVTNRVKNLNVGDGQKTITVSVRDYAGNSISFTDTVSLDQTAPAAPGGVTVNPTGWTNVKNWQISWDSPLADASGITKVHWQLDGGEDQVKTLPAGLLSFALTATNLPDLTRGPHTISFYLEDGVGNANQGNSNSVEIRYDNQMPANPSTPGLGYSNSEKTIALTSGQTYNYANPYFEWGGASDAVSGIAGYYVYFGRAIGANPAEVGAFQESASYQSTGVLAPYVNYYLRVRVMDNAGNISAIPSSDLFRYRFSGTAPTGTVQILTVNGEETTSNPTVQLSLNLADVTEVKVTGDITNPDADFVAYTTTRVITLTAGDGSKTVQVLARNEAGNEASFSDTVTLDQTAPVAPTGVTVNPSGWTETAQWTVSWTNPADAAKVYWRIDSGSYNERSITVGQTSLVINLADVPGLATGTHSLTFYLEDGVGNANSANTGTVSINYGTEPPATTTLTFNLVAGINWVPLPLQGSGITNAEQLWTSVGLQAGDLIEVSNPGVATYVSFGGMTVDPDFETAITIGTNFPVAYGGTYRITTSTPKTWTINGTLPSSSAGLFNLVSGINWIYLPADKAALTNAQALWSDLGLTAGSQIEAPDPGAATYISYGGMTVDPDFGVAVTIGTNFSIDVNKCYRITLNTPRSWP